MSEFINSVASHFSPTYRDKQTQKTQQRFTNAIVTSLKASKVSETHNLTVEGVYLGYDFTLAQSVMKLKIRATEQKGSPPITASDSWSVNKMEQYKSMESFIKVIESEPGLAGKKFDEAVKEHERQKEWLFGPRRPQEGSPRVDPHYFSYTFGVPLPRPTGADEDEDEDEDAK